MKIPDPAFAIDDWVVIRDSTVASLLGSEEVLVGVPSKIRWSCFVVARLANYWEHAIEPLGADIIAVKEKNLERVDPPDERGGQLRFAMRQHLVNATPREVYAASVAVLEWMDR